MAPPGLETMTYERDGAVARITLDRPERGNGITLATPGELAACVERANLDPRVHAIALAGNGSGFCGGYDLASAEQMPTGGPPDTSSAPPPSPGTSSAPPPSPDQPPSPDTSSAPPPSPDTSSASRPGVSGWVAGTGALAGGPVDPAVIAANHDPSGVWDPVVDFQMMSRNVRGFMSLFHSEKPVVCKVHGFCVAGGTDMALCSDLLVIEDEAKIGYPPARVWGVPTTALWAHRIGPARAKRLLLTGDSLSGREAVEWGLASECAPAAELDLAFEALLERVARLPINQLVMHKLLVNQTLLAQGLQATQILGTFFDGVARHTPEGYEFARKAAAEGFREAVRGRDEPFGDFGLGGFTAGGSRR